MTTPHAYQSYLIRLWPGERGGQMHCRATLDEVTTGQHLDFADFEELLAYLRDAEAKLAGHDPAPEPA